MDYLKIMRTKKMTLDEAKAYLKKVNEMSEEQKVLNKHTIEDAMWLSSWVSVAVHGSDDYKKIAIKQIKSI